MTDSKKKRSFWSSLRARYQFNIMNEENYEVKSVSSFSVLNVVIWSFMVFLIIGSIVFAAIAYTPLKQYIPGYGKLDERRQAIAHQAMADSIAVWSEQIDQKLNILELVLRGEIDTGIPAEDLFTNNYDSLKIYSDSEEDSVLRAEMERRERFALFEEEDDNGRSTFNELVFFPPVKGVLSDTFNARSDHFGVDIVTGQNKEVKAVMDGRVLMAEFTIETGYVMAIQHSNELVSIYKHNSQLMRKVGNFIEQGEVIAISGNTGELTSGPHLHFELWYKGEPIDPARYVQFE